MAEIPPQQKPITQVDEQKAYMERTKALGLNISTSNLLDGTDVKRLAIVEENFLGVFRAGLWAKYESAIAKIFLGDNSNLQAWTATSNLTAVLAIETSLAVNEARIEAFRAMMTKDNKALRAKRTEFRGSLSDEVREIMG